MKKKVSSLLCVVFLAGILATAVVYNLSKPRVLIAVDDFAQSLAGKYFVNDPEMDIVFAGVNGSIEPYGYEGAENVTGIFERKQLNAVKETILAFESKKTHPKADPSLLYILETSSSLQKGRSVIDQYDWDPIHYKGSVMADHFEDWKEIVKGNGSRVDYFIVANYRRLPVSEDNPNYADPKAVMAWTEKNALPPVIGINAFNVEDGAMISIGVSPFEQGEVAAKMAQTILEQDIRAGTIPIQSNSQYIVAIRKAFLKARNMELPAIYEAFGRATANFYEE
ncbi:MAG: hypothetical protein HUK40_14090 [Desulfobacter sp.]|nr:hypothetical protein [Desulfobacter sp.]